MKLLTHLFVLTFWLSTHQTSVFAQTIVAAQTIRSKAIISAEDLIILTTNLDGTFTDPSQVIGQEARVVLYPGRPIRRRDIGPPALVERNDIVSLVYISGALFISAEGRALGRAGIGERIRVMNMTSRATLFGIVTGSGEVRIAQ